MSGGYIWNDVGVFSVIENLPHGLQIPCAGIEMQWFPVLLKNYRDSHFKLLGYLLLDHYQIKGFFMTYLDIHDEFVFS